MKRKSIAEGLKEMRQNAKMSVKEISKILTDKGYRASEKTIYSWESGRSEPSPEVLLNMCTAYHVDDVLLAFGYDGYNEDGTLSLNMYEIDIIEKYRTLDTHGKEMVDFTLDKEYERCQVKEEPADYIPDNIRPIDYYRKMASAGSGQVVFEDNVAERITIPDIPEYKRVAYAIGVNGNSMEPLYYDGDILLVEPTVDIRVGEIGIFIVDGEAYVKKLGTNELISLNKEYDNIPLTEYSSCMGRVVDKLPQK